MTPVNLRKLNDEVFVASAPIVRIGPEDVAFIKAQAVGNGRGRARICAHKTDSDPLHEMLIAISRDSYIRPHKHREKTESFHIVEGAVDIVIFDDAGEVVAVVPLSAPGAGGSFFYRLMPGAFHTLVIKSAMLVVHEVTNGPFSRDQSVFAPWSPEEGNHGEITAFQHRVATLAREYVASQSLS